MCVRYEAAEQDQAGLVGERCGEGCTACYHTQPYTDTDSGGDTEERNLLGVREDEVVGR